ncbi:hypothetical protein [Microbacterium sp. NPDC056234]|uniref:hypothetical protein n=1 Tax=Microbacterium sp. NPDC056234 TaxID=3345757 RepID=UPI0035D65E9B
MAERMLNLELPDVPLTRESQFIVGWMRAAFDQSRVIAKLTAEGLRHAIAPNRRAFTEIAFRLLWLRSVDRSKRAAALDTMIANEKRLTTGFYETLKDMGYDHDVDLSEMERILVEAIDDKGLRQQVKAVADAAKAAPITIGLYAAWREETQYTHATAHLAVAYAPEEPADRLGCSRPPSQHGDLDRHHMVCLLIATLATELLQDVGVEKDAAWPIMSTAWNTE